jgi:ectoine hydroxylase-related dioxygenase (phytanoyl-CoA dioxygenase family)
MHGYAKIDGVLPVEICSSLSELLDEIRLIREKISTETSTADTLEEKRFLEATGQILLRDIFFQRPQALLPFISLPPVIEIVSTVLKDEFILDAHSASNSFHRNPRYRHPPKIHVDSPLPVTDISHTTHIGVMICIDDFTMANGGTRIWPGSHKSGVLVHKTPGFSEKQLPGYVEIHANKGSMLFFPGQTWHQVGTNIDGSSRWTLIFWYTRWWIKPQTDYIRCGEAIFNLCSTQQKALLGFSSKPPKNTMLRYKTLINHDSISNNYEEALDF